MSAKHLPTVVWMFRPFGSPRNGYVRTLDRSNLEIVLPGPSDERVWLALPRRDARLLARRILQCLEDTK